MNSNVSGSGAAADDDDEVKKNHCNFRLQIVTFEPRHENKSCSACPEDQLKPF